MNGHARLLSLAAALVRDAAAKLGLRFAALVASTWANAALEGIALAMLLPLLAALGVAGEGQDPVTRLVGSLYARLGVGLHAYTVGAGLLLVLAASAAVFLWNARVATAAQAAFAARWQRDVFSALAGASWAFLRRQKAGDVVNALTAEAQRLGGAFYQVNLAATSAAFLVFHAAIAAAIAPVVTIFLVAGGIALFAATRPLLARALADGHEMTEANARLQASAAEVVGSFKLFKATANESEARALLDGAIGAIETLGRRSAFEVQLVRAIFEYGSGAAVALLLIAGPLVLGIDAAAAIVIVAILVRLFPKITGLRQCLQSLSLVLPAFEALQALLRAAAAAREKDEAQEVGGAVNAGFRGQSPVSLRFEKVTVRAEDGKRILDGIDLAAEPGRLVAIVGPTGAGKTTLLDCALGLIEPERGEVRIDGAPLGRISRRAWRRSVGYLGQEPVLFGGTLRDNVAWGRPLDDAGIVAALDMAHARFALSLPGGLDAVLGERRNALSGGERQRIALARALAGTPRLLVLDEPTSALDPETEEEIAAALIALKGKVTVLLVTHRLRLAQEADHVAVLEGGVLVEQGHPRELIAAGGRFSAMWAAGGPPAQHGAAALAPAATP